jgi:hypothetical protein
LTRPPIFFKIILIKAMKRRVPIKATYSESTPVRVGGEINGEARLGAALWIISDTVTWVHVIELEYVST